MKKVSYTLVFLLLPLLPLIAQCPNASVFLHSQAEIDQFLVDYGTCTQFDKGLTIIGDDITSLEGLCNLRAIQGDLIICENPLLPNLQGLEELELIGGDLEIKVNASLSSLEGLNKLVSIGKDLIIFNNASLINLNGLELLTSIGMNFNIKNNASLVNVDGLCSLTSVGYDFLICDNPSLEHVDGLYELDFVGKDFTVKNNINLTDCTGLCPFLEQGYVGTEITIKDNPSECSSVDEVETACLVLPISWESFSARVTFNAVTLNWTTSEGQLNDRFVIEHCPDGIHFSKIGEVSQPLTNAFVGLEYSFVHNSPRQGDNYYRLVHTPFEAAPLYSEIVLVNYHNRSGFSIHPKACVDELYFDFPEEEFQSVSIYSMDGRLMRQWDFPSSPLDVSQLIPGQYIFRASDGYQFHQSTFVKLKL